MEIPTYDELQRLLSEAHASMDAAESHGLLSGALASTIGYFPEDWVREVLPQGGLDPQFSALLQALYDHTAQALEGVGMDFQAFLPDDEDPIGVRVAALAGWCRGFLQGFSSNVRLETDDLPEEIGEVLGDLNEIIDVDLDEKVDEEAEEAYVELTEFVRVGGQLVYDELRALRAQGAEESSSIN